MTRQEHIQYINYFTTLKQRWEKLDHPKAILIVKNCEKEIQHHEKAAADILEGLLDELM